MTSRTRLLTATVAPALGALLLSACSAGSAADGAAGAPGGGGVGFGGAQDVGQFRSILEAGGIPAASTLDAAGFFAEHYVEMPPADCGQPLCLQAMSARGNEWTANGVEEQIVLAVAMNTPIGPDDIEPRPLDLVVVVDTSGSMATDARMDYVRQGLHLLVDAVDEDDRLALVSYQSFAEVHAELPALPVEETPEEPTEPTDPVGEPTDPPADPDEDPVDEREAWRSEMHALVDTLQPGGGTNIYEGLERGFEIAKEARVNHPDRAQRVILLSDGLATEGITDSASIIALSEAFIEGGMGLTTVGVGASFNVELMRGLAERGAGNFYFVEDPEAVREVFTEELDYFAEPLATAVSIEVRTTDGYGLGEVVGTRLWSTEGNSGSMYLPAVFVASRKSSAPGEYGGRRGGGGMLFLPLYPSIDTGFSEAAALVTLRYSAADGAPGSEQSQTTEVIIPARFGASEVIEEPVYSSDAMVKPYAMYNIYRGLHAGALTAENDYTCALEQLQLVSRQAELWNLERDDQDIAADLELMSMFENNLRAYGAYDLGPEQSCYGYGYPPYGDDVYYDDGPYYGCSAAGSGAGAGAGLALLWLALPLLRRRRRA